MSIKKSAASLLLLAVFVRAEKLPEWLVPCYRDDPGFNDCATKTGQTAIPKLIPGDAKLRVPPLDPLEVTEIHVPKDANTLGIDFLMRDVKLFGLSKAELREFRVDFEKKHIAYSIYTPVLTFLCTYNVSGSILLLPIAGNGPANITLNEMEPDINFDDDLIENCGDNSSDKSAEDE